MSLRQRLLLVVLTMAAGVIIVVGAVAYSVLERHLVDREKTPVEQAVGGIDRALAGTGERADVRGLDVGTFGALLGPDGRTLATIPASEGGVDLPPPRIPEDVARAADEHRGPRVVAAESGPGRYMLVARHAGQGRGSTVVVATSLDDVDELLNELRVIGGVATVVELLLLLGFGAWAIRVGLRPLDRIEATASTIAAGDLSQRVEPDNATTEIGRLGHALNTMLAQIEQAMVQREASEGRMRRFLADASHGLRTPLTTIRGYAEAFRLGAAADPEDLARAMRRIEHAAERMGILVEDLLVLARLDAVPDVEGQPVDLTAIVDDACGDARVVGPDRRITYDAAGPVVVIADADQVHQIVDNLLRNALVHTPAGTAIEVTVTADAARGVLVVRDHGPGLPADQLGQVFERFWRDDAGRARDAGAGLGLAIVEAIVRSHGGTAHAANAPGGGAVFTIALPLAAS